MSVKRKDLVRYFEQNGFKLIREGGNHSIFSNGTVTILPTKSASKLALRLSFDL